MKGSIKISIMTVSFKLCSRKSRKTHFQTTFSDRSGPSPGPADWPKARARARVVPSPTFGKGPKNLVH